MKSILLILCCIACCGMAAQDSEVRSFSAFHGISVSASIEATLVKGSTNEVSLTVKDIDLEDVITKIEDDVLKVGMKNKKGVRNWFNSSKVTAVITYTEALDNISVSSSANIESRDMIKSNALAITASSSGDMTIEIDVEVLSGTVSSSGDINISGSAGTASVTASSSGDFNGKKLAVGNATLTASSSADIHLTVNGALTATASSSGDIHYYGKPTSKNVNKSSGGDVEGHSGS